MPTLVKSPCFGKGDDLTDACAKWIEDEFASDALSRIGAQKIEY